MDQSNRFSRRKCLKLTAGIYAGVLGSGIASANAPSATCFQAVPGTDLGYYLLALDKFGKERQWSDGSLCSTSILRSVSEQPVTDVFIFSHGWMGDVTQANSQYVNWTLAMAECKADIKKMRDRKGGFSPLLIGVHWPSLPFGNEELLAGYSAQNVDAEAELANQKFGNTPRSKAALKKILRAAKEGAGDTLSPDLVEAFKSLRSESVEREGGVAGRPGADGDSFDPEKLFEAIRTDLSKDTKRGAFAAGDDSSYTLLYLMATISFWTMKDRARIVGEKGVNPLIRSLQQAVQPGRNVRFHLMGHSFGCIVVSASLLGTPGTRSQVRPISSLSLVQGAFSHWSYALNAYDSKSPGYFRSIIDDKLVSGPIVTTQSNLDSAVGTLYPYAAGIAREVVMAKKDSIPFPRYGAVGTHGLQGTNCDTNAFDILDIHQTYGFEDSKIYNIDCSRVICKKYPLSGAHSDICHSEVAHAVWEAVAHSSSDQDSTPVPPIPEPPLPIPPAPSAPEPAIGPLRRLLRRRR